MSKQTRRSIRVQPDTYDRIKIYCDEHGISFSHFCEVAIAKRLGYEPPAQRKKQRPGRQITHEPVSGYNEF